MVVYMLKFMEWASTQEQPKRIMAQVHKTITNEKTYTGDLASKYRRYIHQLLKGEQNKLEK
jgi:hypothetical protein